MTNRFNILKKMHIAALLLAMQLVFAGCERPILHLHEEGNGCIIDIPKVEINLETVWDYNLIYGVNYEWEGEWYYGWDEIDQSLFGDIGYTMPDVFNVRRYFVGRYPGGKHQSVTRHTLYGTQLKSSFSWGFWDILMWNDIRTFDGVQSLIFDEESSLEYVTARTNQTMHPSRYNSPVFEHSFYEPEALFSAYEQDIDINPDMNGFVYNERENVWIKNMNIKFEPITYIYLTQVILHNNKGRICGIDGNANLSSMARSVNVNTGVAGSDAITVNYNVRYKTAVDVKGEKVDIAGGRLMTFGMCNVNANRVTRAGDFSDPKKHYMDLTVLFNNGLDSTFVFDVTDQVSRLFKGGVLTVELDMDTVPLPSRAGGSGFDAVVKDFDEEQYEFDM